MNTYVPIFLLVACVSGEKCRKCFEYSTSSGSNHTVTRSPRCSNATEENCPDSTPDCTSLKWSGDWLDSSNERQSFQWIDAKCGVAGKWTCEMHIRDSKRAGRQNITCEIGLDVWAANSTGDDKKAANSTGDDKKAADSGGHRNYLGPVGFLIIIAFLFLSC